MSKLSAPLKALIAAPHARPNTLPAPPGISQTYSAVARAAQAKGVGLKTFLTFSAAATFTMNSPDSLLQLYRLATATSSPFARAREGEKAHGVWTAELMREIGLKCIGLNGVPRTINCLGAFYGGLPAGVRAEMDKRPARRALRAESVVETVERGRWMWDRIYHPFTDKLTAKLAQSHPDLPVFIVEGEYGALFSEPPFPASAQSNFDPASIPNVGRLTTSIFAVAVLRAQGGVGPQIVSHVFGLRKAFEDGTDKLESDAEGAEWLAGDEGSCWLLEQVDRIVADLSEGTGPNFASGRAKEVEEGGLKAKL